MKVHLDSSGKCHTVCHFLLSLTLKKANCINTRLPPSNNEHFFFKQEKETKQKNIPGWTEFIYFSSLVGNKQTNKQTNKQKMNEKNYETCLASIDLLLFSDLVVLPPPAGLSSPPGSPKVKSFTNLTG